MLEPSLAAIAFKVKEGSIDVVATAIGAVPCEQTVFRAEAMAALFVTEHTEGDIDVTLDCLGVKKQTESYKTSRKSEDLFDGLRSEQDRVIRVLAHFCLGRISLLRDTFVACRLSATSVGSCIFLFQVG